MNNPNAALLLTEDGHPIGTIVVEDNVSLPPVVANDEVVAENRDALLRAEAQELTGDPNADSAVAELYPGYSDIDRRNKAAKLFIVERMPIADIAKEVNVPPRTVSIWAYNYRWDSTVKKELAVQQAQSLLELARLRADRRLEVAKQQLDQAKVIREEAVNAVKTGKSLQGAATAWAAAAKVEQTLTGVSEAGTVSNIVEDPDAKGDAKGKQPLVMVFNGGLPPVRKAGK